MIERFLCKRMDLGFFILVQITLLCGSYIWVQKCRPRVYHSPLSSTPAAVVPPASESVVPPVSVVPQDQSQSPAIDSENETLIIVVTPTHKRAVRFICF